jgi:aspartate kinase
MKFGGASVKNAGAIRNVAEIIIRHQREPLLVVVSAMDKTTNQLEILAEKANSGDDSGTFTQFEKVLSFHKEIVEGLFGEEAGPVLNRISQFFGEIERIIRGILLLEEFPTRTYDRIVAYGELVSTTIVADYLRWVTGDCIWMDVRELIRTDSNHKQANVIQSISEQNIQEKVLPLLEKGKLVVTQGFIGSTLSGKTTTLGREGSDYTAAIFANALNANRLVVWKDVPGVLNADPRLMPEAVKHPQLSYEEAVEMTFYGATVIHPKTIKPLHEKQIPMQVRSFLHTEEPGTRISEAASVGKITSYILKKKQAVIKVQPRDFSFMDESLMQDIFHHTFKTGIKVSLIQHSAISLMLCVDDHPGLIDSFRSTLLDRFHLETMDGLELQTILNFTVRDLKLAEKAVMVQQHGNKLFLLLPAS